MSRITELALKHLKGKVSEKVGGRGDGSLLFERRPWGGVEVYYRYRSAGADDRIKLGEYRKAGLTLRACREKCSELAQLRREHPNLKEWLEMDRVKAERAEKEALRRHQDEQLRGTLADLIDAYVGHLDRQGKDAAKRVRYLMKHYVTEPFPHLAGTKAAEITSDDIVMIIRKMLSDGVTTTSNRVRSYLMAAFNYGMNADHDPRQVNEHGKRFNVTANPVQAVPRQADFEQARDRVLTPQEIRLLWFELSDAPNVGPLMVALVRLLIALGGQRPKQMLACRWADYDLQRRQVTIIDRKGRRAEPRKHIVPLTDRALGILDEVRFETGIFEWPFTAIGKTPFTDHAVSVAINRHLENQAAASALHDERETPEKYLLKDIRRTCKHIMIDAGVSRDDRNLIQHHGLTGVDFNHYDHHEHLPEKREALRRYDRQLERVLLGHEVNVLDFPSASAATGVSECGEA